MNLETNKKYKIRIPHSNEKLVHVDFKLRCPKTGQILYVLRWWRKFGRFWEREIHSEKSLKIWNDEIK